MGLSANNMLQCAWQIEDGEMWRWGVSKMEGKNALKEETTDFSILVRVWTSGMKVMGERNMSRRVVILMKYNGQTSNIKNLQFTMEYYANFITPGESQSRVGGRQVNKYLFLVKYAMIEESTR